MTTTILTIGDADLVHISKIANNDAASARTEAIDQNGNWHSIDARQFTPQVLESIWAGEAVTVGENLVISPRWPKTIRDDRRLGSRPAEQIAEQIGRGPDEMAQRIMRAWEQQG